MNYSEVDRSVHYRTTLSGRAFRGLICSVRRLAATNICPGAANEDSMFHGVCGPRCVASDVLNVRAFGPTVSEPTDLGSVA